MAKEIFAFSNICEEKLTYTWTIQNLETFPAGSQVCFQGPTFNVNFDPKTLWTACLHWEGSSSSHNVYGSRLVIQADSNLNPDILRVKYIVNLKNKAGSSKELERSEIPLKSASDKITVYIPTIQGLKRENYLEEGSLIIECLLTFVSYTNCLDILTEKNSSEDMICLSENFRNLYTTKMYHDFTLKVENESIFVHKCVLASRSKVFAAMFDKEPEENEKNELILNDFGADTMKCLIEYLYTGKVSDVSSDMYFQLYSASDKYDIQVLKKTCINEIIKRLDASNACDVYALSYFHNDATMETAATRYIQQNSASVLTSNSWKIILAENVKIAIEILTILSNVL